MKTPVERFLKKTDKNGPNPTHVDGIGACWTWIGAKRPSGYGTFMWNGKVGSAHRFSYSEFVGEIPTGYDVMHKCDNPSCVNPDHLSAGTRKQNMEDCITKGRLPSGESRYNNVITEETVLKIRKLFDSGEFRIFQLAKHFGVSRSCIDHIVKRQNWRRI